MRTEIILRKIKGGDEKNRPLVFYRDLNLAPTGSIQYAHECGYSDASLSCYYHDTEPATFKECKVIIQRVFPEGYYVIKKKLNFK